MYGRVKRPEVAFRKQTRRWRLWRITLFVLGLSAIRILHTLFVITVVLLLPFVRILSLDLRMIFTAVALVTRVVAGIISFGKKTR
jgi:hypothetical protein